MRPFTLRLAAAVSAGSALAGLAAANITVYDNFGPGNGGFDYNWGLGWTVAGEDVPNQFGVEQAFLFTPSDSGPVSDIWVAMWYVPLDAGVDEVVVRLAENTNGSYPLLADVMQEWTISDFEDWSAWSPPHHLVGDGGSILEAGTSYWLWAAPANDTTWTGWCMNLDPGLTLPHTLRREGEDWLAVGNETASAFRVDVVPTPGSLGLLGAAGLLAMRRR